MAADLKTHSAVEYKGVTTNAVTPAYYEIQPPQPQHSFTHILCLSSYATDARRKLRLQKQRSVKQSDLNEVRNELRALAKLSSINSFHDNPDRRWL
jgi:hypothetical protein